MRRGRSARQGGKDIRRPFRRYRIDRAKSSLGKWSRRLLLVALGVLLTLLVQEIWPEKIDGLTQDIKSRTQGFLGASSNGGPVIQDDQKPASPDLAVPTPSFVPIPTPSQGVPARTPVFPATPLGPGLIIEKPTHPPDPQPTPTSQPRNTPTPSVWRQGTQLTQLTQVTKDWIDAVELEIHRLTNEERVQHSVTALSYDPSLASIARGHSGDMAQLDYFGHENFLGQTPSDRAAKAGYGCRKDYGSYYSEGIAENIFQTSLYSSYTTTPGGLVVSRDYMTMEEIAAQIVEGWMDSPGHRENILDSSYEKEGIGVAVSAEEKVYITQNFC